MYEIVVTISFVSTVKAYPPLSFVFSICVCCVQSFGCPFSFSIMHTPILLFINIIPQMSVRFNEDMMKRNAGLDFFGIV